MPAVEIAAQGTFPEKLMEFVLINTLLQHGVIEFEHDFFLETEAVTHEKRENK